MTLRPTSTPNTVTVSDIIAETTEESVRSATKNVACTLIRTRQGAAGCQAFGTKKDVFFGTVIITSGSESMPTE